jgi:hypothetical protein
MPRQETLVKPSLIRSSTLFVSVALAAFALAGCARKPSPAPEPAPAPEAAPAPAVDTAAADAAKAADEARAAELAAKEKELADREAALKQQELEAELARRDAENAAAAKAQAAKAAAARKTPPKAAAAGGAAAGAAAASKPAEPPKPIVVPAGTQLAIQVNSALSTKTAKVGDRVDAKLSSDVVIGGRKAASAGATVTGSVFKVVSGSSGVGKTPKLTLTFDNLVASNGATVPIAAKYQQLGKSEKGQDTAKIVGGAAVGAIIGNQVSHSGGSVIGGVLGAGAGTAIANKTGSEVEIPAGTVVTVATGAEFEVKPK